MTESVRLVPSSAPSRIVLASLLAAAAVGTVVCGGESSARAAGLYFTDRGVRPMSRGGAFVAGADDLGAMHYNPAGLADAGTSLLLDTAWLNFSSDYTRSTQVTDASGAVRTYNSPTVHGSSPVLPIPTLGVSIALDKERTWTLAAGVFAPYAAISSYPQTLNGQPSPSRYSLVSLDGSLLAIPGVYAAYKPFDWLRVGAGVMALVGTFDSSIVFNANPKNRLLAAPEDPNYDAFSQLKARPVFAPSANVGTTIVPNEHVRIGLAYQLPFVVNAPTTLNVKLPTAVEFDHAYQSGDTGRIRFELPPEFRAGVEVRGKIANDLLRVELAYVREFWTVHHDIEVDPNVKLYGITGFPSPYGVGTIDFPRHFENSNSVRLGGEFTFPFADHIWDLRAGVDYDQSGIPTAYLSPLTVDLARVTLGMGASLHIGEHWRFDGIFAHVFASDATVDPALAAIKPVNPVQGNPTAAESTNGGQYSARAEVLGVGLNYLFK